MKICVVVQSEAFLDSAGMRIRYNRIIDAAAGSSFEVVPIETLKNLKDYPHDVYIFSKTFTPDAHVMGRYLASLGKTVGQDFFDDYFSQYGDARLAQYRGWLREMAPCTHFAICTTERMAAVLRDYLPGIPITTVEDPAPAFDPEELSRLLAAKRMRAAEERRIRVVWFGIGDNPFFPVGLRDLAAHASELVRLHRLGWVVELVVLTNARAMNADGLQLLGRLGLPAIIKLWSEEVEYSELRDATVAFIPVGVQPFSTAKSLNRCVTALIHGCQVLSVGNPIYRVLDAFIYRSATELTADLTGGELRLRPATVPAFEACLLAGMDSSKNAAAFLAAVGDATGGARRGPSQLCLIHGLESSSANHKLVSRLRGYSIRSPFHHARLNYHVRIDVDRDGYQVFVVTELAKVIRPAIAARLDGTYTIGDKTYAKVPRELTGLDEQAPHNALLSGSLAARIAVYPSEMRKIVAACGRLFENADIVVSENNRFAPRIEGSPRR